jgi:hypothetical protein
VMPPLSCRTRSRAPRCTRTTRCSTARRRRR